MWQDKPNKSPQSFSENSSKSTGWSCKRTMEAFSQKSSLRSRPRSTWWTSAHSKIIMSKSTVQNSKIQTSSSKSKSNEGISFLNKLNNSFLYKRSPVWTISSLRIQEWPLWRNSLLSWSDKRTRPSLSKSTHRRFQFLLKRMIVVLLGGEWKVRRTSSPLLLISHTKCYRICRWM